MSLELVATEDGRPNAPAWACDRIAPSASNSREDASRTYAGVHKLFAVHLHDEAVLGAEGGAHMFLTRLCVECEGLRAQTTLR